MSLLLNCTLTSDFSKTLKSSSSMESVNILQFAIFPSESSKLISKIPQSNLFSNTNEKSGLSE
ncbi:hypothetical protein DSECCO2_574240 [anaerobic digester metagenome]